MSGETVGMTKFLVWSYSALSILTHTSFSILVYVITSACNDLVFSRAEKKSNKTWEILKKKQRLSCVLSKSNRSEFFQK